MPRITEEYLRQLPGYGLATAVIEYYFPDYPHIISVRTFTRQLHDACPDFPRLNEYIKWWVKQIDGKINLVTVGHVMLLQRRELKYVNGMYQLSATKH